MKIVDYQQRTPEWHQWRNEGVSASEAIVVLDRCPHKTPYRLYTEKTGLTLPENLDGNLYVQRGIQLEAAARASFERRNRTLLLPVCAESEEHPFLRASFDGIDDDGIPVELKVPMPANYQDVIQNGEQSKVYQRYYYQVQQQIAVAGTDYGMLSFYDGGHLPAVDFKVLRNDALIEILIEKAKMFVQGLKRNQPPLADPERDLYLPSGPEQAQWNLYAASYHRLETKIDEAKATLNDLEAEQAEAEQGMLSLMGDYTQAEYAGVRVNRYRQQGAIDYKAALTALVPNLDPALLEQFRKNGSERVKVTSKSEDKATVPYEMTEVLSAKGGDFWF